MVDRVLIAWSRRAESTDGEHLLDGYVSLEARGRIVSCETFEGFPYRQMISRVSSALRTNPDAKLFMLRIEAGSSAQEVEPTLAKLLRDDPVAYIRATSAPPRRVTLHVESAPASPSTVVELKPLKAGHDTLADAFGDMIYLAVRRSKHSSTAFELECSGCGRWSSLATAVGTQLFECFRCGFTLWGRRLDSRWFLSGTQQLLLQGGRPRYYLPRAWNSRGLWISHEDLTSQYQQYIKEKQACLDSNKDTAPSA